MALDRLTQITSSGISSTSTITVSAIAGVITATSVTVGSAVTINSSGINAGVVTATSFRVGTGGTIITTTDDGLVGIGITNPSKKLHVDNGSAIISNPTPGPGGSVLLVTDEGTATTVTGGATLRVSNNGSASNFAVFEASSTSSNFVITNAGNVGIGTTDPTAKLEVKQTSLRQGIRVQHENNDSTLRLYVDSSNSTAAVNSSFITTGSYLPLTFLTSDTERVRITGIGSVGIGLTDPNARLTIKSFGANTTPLNIQNSGSTSIFKISQSTGGSGILELRDSTDKTYMIADTSSGFVGVGTANPDSIFQVGSGPDAIVNGFSNSRLVVSDSGNTQADVFVRCHSTDVMARMTVVSTNAVFGSVSNHPVEFWVNNTNQLSIDTSGNLLPAGDANRNLGSPAARWANIYSADLQLSNEGSKNDVDGTWGKYTIQEGENDLFLINRRTGKKYKFLLEEVQ